MYSPYTITNTYLHYLPFYREMDYIKNEDISNKPLKEVLDSTISAYVTIKDIYTGNTYHVDLHDPIIAQQNKTGKGTVIGVLNSFVVRELPTINNIPFTILKSVTYQYNINHDFNIAVEYDKYTKKPKSFKYYNRRYDNYWNEYLDKHTLVTMNGLVHRKILSDNAFTIVDGYVTATRSRRGYVGLIDFTNIAGLKEIPITTAMVVNNGETDNTQITSIKIDISTLNYNSANQTLLFIHNGCILSDILSDFSIVGNELILTIDNKVLDRVQKTSRYLDYSSIANIDKTNNSVDYNELFTYGFHKKALTWNHSFLVLVDKRLTIKEFSVDNSYIGYPNNKYMLTQGHGLLKYHTYYNGFTGHILDIDNLFGSPELTIKIGKNAEYKSTASTNTKVLSLYMTL